MSGGVAIIVPTLMGWAIVQSHVFFPGYALLLEAPPHRTPIWFLNFYAPTGLFLILLALRPAPYRW